MSYILDALKKQEQDREIGHTPTVETHQSESGVKGDQRTLALWLTIILLLAVVAFLAGFLWSRLEAPVPVSQPQAAAPSAEPGARSTSAAKTSLKPVKQFSAPIPSSPEPQPSQQTVVEKPVQQRATPTVTTAPKTPENAPLLDNLSYTERQGLPPLSLDVHVYAEQAERRFVLLNLKKMREGDKLDDIYLEAITPAGVVLAHNGVRFRLQRQ